MAQREKECCVCIPWFVSFQGDHRLTDDKSIHRAHLAGCHWIASDKEDTLPITLSSFSHHIVVDFSHGGGHRQAGGTRHEWRSSVGIATIIVIIRVGGRIHCQHDLLLGIARVWERRGEHYVPVTQFGVHVVYLWVCIYVYSSMR